jgi:hypothetical protein
MYGHSGGGMAFYTGDSVTISVQPILAQPSFSLFPNPGSGDLKLLSDQRIESVSVFDARGGLVYSSEIEANQWNLDTKGWSAGIYIVQCEIASKKCFQRWVRW